MKIMRMFTFILAVLILISTIPLTAFASAASVPLEEWQSNGLVDVSGELLPNGVKGIKKVSSDKTFPDNPNRYTVEIRVESEAPSEAKNGNLLFIIARKNGEALNAYKAILQEVLPEILTEDSGNQVSIIALGDTVEVLWENGNYSELENILTAISSLTPSSGIHLDKALRMVREEFLTQNSGLETFLMVDDVVGYSTKVTKTASSVYCGDNCSNPQWTVLPTEYMVGQTVGDGTTDKNGIHFERVSVPVATCNRQRVHTYLVSSGKYPTMHSDVAGSEAQMLMSEGGVLYIYSGEIISGQTAVYSTMKSTGYYNNRVDFENILIEKYGVKNGAAKQFLLKDVASTFAIIDETTISATSSEKTPVLEVVGGEIFCSFFGDVVLQYSFMWDVLNPNFSREVEYSVGSSAQYPTTVNYTDEIGEERFLSLSQPKARGFYGKVYANGYLINYLMEPLGEDGKIVADKKNAKVLLKEGVEIGNPDGGGENRWLPNARIMVSTSTVAVEGYLPPETQQAEIELTLEGDKDSTIFFPLYKEYGTLTIKYEFQADLNSAPPSQKVEISNIEMGTMLHKGDIANFTEAAIMEGAVVIPPEYELTENSIVFPTAQVISDLETKVFLIKKTNETKPGGDPTYSFSLASYKRTQNNELQLIDEKQSGEFEGTSSQFILSSSLENLQEGYILAADEYTESIGNSSIRYKLDKIFVNSVEKELDQWFALEEGSAGNQIRVEYTIAEMVATEVEAVYKLSGSTEKQVQILRNVPVDATGQGVEGKDYPVDLSLWSFFSTNYEFIGVKLFQEGREPRELNFNLDQKTFENLSLETEKAYIEISFFATHQFPYTLYFDGIPYSDMWNVSDYGEEITFDKLVGKQNSNWQENYEVVEGLSPNLPIPSYEVEDYFAPGKSYLEVYLAATAKLPYEIQFYEKLESGEVVLSKTLWYEASIPPTVKIDDQLLALAGLNGNLIKSSFFTTDGILVEEASGEDLFATITFNRNLFKLYYGLETAVEPPDPEDPKDPEIPVVKPPTGEDVVEVETLLLFGGEEVEEVHPYEIDTPVFLWQANKKQSYNYHEYELSQVEVFKTVHNSSSGGVVSLGFSEQTVADTFDLATNTTEMDEVVNGEPYVFEENYDYTMNLYYKKISFVGSVDEGDNLGNNNFVVVEGKKSRDVGSYKGEAVDKAVLPAVTKKETVENQESGGSQPTVSPINSTYSGTYPSATLPRSGRPAEQEEIGTAYKLLFLYNLVIVEVALIIPKRKIFLGLWQKKRIITQ